MLRLILMRHAKSDWGAGLEDHARPLNARGLIAATALGNWLRARGYVPDHVLCSTAERTRQTLSGLALAEVTTVEFARALYLADSEDMLGLLRGSEAKTVLMIGHNPGAGESAERLLMNPHEHTRFHDYPTGATLVADFDADRWNDIGWRRGQPIDFTVPRDLT